MKSLLCLVLALTLPAVPAPTAPPPRPQQAVLWHPQSVPLTVPLDPATRDRIDTFPVGPRRPPSSFGGGSFGGGSFGGGYSDPTSFGPSSAPTLTPYGEDPVTHDRCLVPERNAPVTLSPPRATTAPYPDAPQFAHSPSR